MTPAELSRTVLCTVRRAVEAGELRAPVPARAVVRRPPRPGCGDYATNIALQLAKGAGRSPRQVAEILRPRIEQAAGVARVDIAEPGFLNITLEDGSDTALVQAVLASGASYGHQPPSSESESYGHSDPRTHRPAVELSFPYDTRAAVTADALARILRARGATDVTLRCEREPDPVWEELGVTTDTETYGSVSAADEPAVRHVIRPVPVKVPAHDLLRTLGPDATRWALLRPAAHDHPRTAPAQLLAQRESNPLFRVQYAHARARALLRNAADLGITDPAAGDPGDPGNPGDKPSLTTFAPLLAALGEYPAVLASAARLRAPDRVARHLEALADAFFRFHDTCPVLPRGDEKPEGPHRARAALAQAAGTVLAGGLHLLGITAPTHL
ncbi:ArgS-related anticodon-binding protein NrtL [Streptomyces sp. 8N616]|uniref:ArgS-related anticodon-binding protein NrtL n=1 Tax=Streptomyces sp. 8N616 TaxID=3457414 RepID=UPI003FD65CBE